MNFLNGYKTYLVAALMVILSGLKAQGYIDANTYQTVMGLAGSLGIAFLRHGVSTEARKAVKDATIVPSPTANVASTTIVTPMEPVK
jgi:hypothetical protein